jgi:hypothetical protein
MAEEDVENGLERTVEQWYDTILLVLNGMKVAAEKKAQIEVNVIYEEAQANAEAQRKNHNTFHGSCLLFNASIPFKYLIII